MTPKEESDVQGWTIIGNMNECAVRGLMKLSGFSPSYWIELPSRNTILPVTLHWCNKQLEVFVFIIFRTHPAGLRGTLIVFASTAKRCPEGFSFWGSSGHWTIILFSPSSILAPTISFCHCRYLDTIFWLSVFPHKSPNERYFPSHQY